MERRRNSHLVLHQTCPTNWVHLKMLNELSRNSRYSYLFADEVAVAEKLPIGIEIISDSRLSVPFELQSSSVEGKFSVYYVRDFDVGTSVDIVRNIILSMPFHRDLSANLLNNDRAERVYNDRAEGVYLEFARALFRTRAAKGFFTESQIGEGRNRLRETASVGVRKAAAEVTRLIRRPRRRMHIAEARAPDRQEVKRWLAGNYRSTPS